MDFPGGMKHSYCEMQTVISFLGFAAILDWVVCLVTMIMMPVYTKDDFKTISHRTLWNPFNVVFISSALTEQGKRIRKIFVATAILFPCLLGLAVFFSSLHS